MLHENHGKLPVKLPLPSDIRCFAKVGVRISDRKNAMKIVQGLVSVAIVLFVMTAAVPASAATIAHWSFSDAAAGTTLGSTASGPVAVDSIGGREMLSLTGTQTFSSDVPGPGVGPTSLQVDGTGYARQVTPGTSTTLDDSSFDFGAGQAFTIEGFFKTAGAVTGSSQAFLDKREVPNSSGSGVLRGFRLFIDTSGRLQWLADDGTVGGRAGFDDAVLDDGEWHHFAAIRESDGDLRIFVDYVEDVTPDMNSNGTNIPGSLANGGTLKFGSALTGPLGSNLLTFEGLLDDIRISDEVLTVDQFLTSTAVPSAAVPEPGSVAIWSLFGLVALTAYALRRRKR